MLAEGLTEGTINESSTYAKKAIKALYKEVEKSKMTSHKYSDNDWKYVHQLMDVIKGVNTFVSDLSYHVENGGYRTNGNTKDWELDITLTTGELIHGRISAFAAGTVKDPWSSYDMTATFW